MECRGGRQGDKALTPGAGIKYERGRSALLSRAVRGVYQGTTFSLIPDWVNRLKEADNSIIYIELQKTQDNRFEALFVMLGSIRSRQVISSFIPINILTT